MIIDMHVHAFPDEIAEAAIMKISKTANIKSCLDGTIDSVIKSMKDSGIDYSVIQSIATKPSQTIKINNWSAQINKISGIIAFGSINPDNEDWENELYRIKQLGIKGIKLHPDYQRFFIDEEKMLPIYKTAFDLDLAILIHAGLDIGLPEPVHCTPYRISKVLNIFEGNKVVFAHMGSYTFWDDFEKYLAGSNIYIDTSYAISMMPLEQALRIISKHGYNKVLYATDSPWTNQKTELEYIRNMGLSEIELEAILGGNAAKILDIG